MSSLYLYCVTRASDLAPVISTPVGAPRSGDAVSIESIECNGLGVFCSPTDETELPRKRRNLLAHTRTIEAAMEHGPVLPMRFGVVASSADALQRLLGPRASELRQKLEDFAGLHETRVRVDWPRDECMRRLTERHPELVTLHREISEKGAAAYQSRIDLGRRVASLLEDWRKNEERSLLQRLEPFARGVAVQAPEDDMQLLRADFLLDHAGEAMLTDALETWHAENGGLARLRLVGPAPIFNFVSLQLDGPDFAETAA